MIGALERHPGVRVGLHYTGPLLEWLRVSRPEAITRLRALADRGQVEILGGAYYEPIIASLPERDRHGQLVRMGDELETLFGRRPRGAWLAERVWEPSLPFDLGGIARHDARGRGVAGGAWRTRIIHGPSRGRAQRRVRLWIIPLPRWSGRSS